MQTSSADRVEVVVVDVDLPFMSIVHLMIKWALASIPAIVLLWMMALLVGGLFMGIFGHLAPR